MLRHVLADVTPLHESREFRLLYFGEFASSIGRQVTVVAVPYQVFVMTGSSLMVALVSLAQFGPLLVTSIVGGAVADAVDRRRLLIITHFFLGCTSACFAINAMLPSPAVWPLFVLSAITAALYAIDAPTRNAAIPTLVSRSQLPAAYALHTIQQQASRIIGPAIGGVLIAQVSLASAYWIDAGTFVVSIAALIQMLPMKPEGGGQRMGLGSIAEGIRFLRGRPVLKATFAIDMNAMIFGLPRVLFPEFGTVVLGGDAATVGLLYAAPGAGAAVAALSSGWVSRVHRQGRAVLMAVAMWGVGITIFGLTSNMWLGLAMLAVAGAADVVSSIFRKTILQLRVPDALRGRLSGIHVAAVTGGPHLGDVEAGAVSSLTSPRFAIASGGVASIVGLVIIHFMVPRFVHVASDDDDIVVSTTDVGPTAVADATKDRPAGRPT